MAVDQPTPPTSNEPLLERDQGTWPNSRDGRFSSGNAWVTFYVRLPFPFPLASDRGPRFTWHDARYADPNSEDRMGAPPCVDARLVHITLSSEEAPPFLRAGLFEGLQLLLDKEEETENGIPPAEIPPMELSEEVVQTW
jgi:hypothetical protein